MMFNSNSIRRNSSILKACSILPAIAVAFWIMLCATLPATAQLAWSPAVNGMDGAFIEEFYFDETGAPVAGSWNGVYHYEGGRWKKAEKGLMLNDFWHTPSGAILANGYEGVYKGKRDLYRYSNDTRVWQKIIDSISPSYLMENRDGSITMFVSGSGKGFISTDDGITWAPGKASMPEKSWYLYEDPTGAWFCQDDFWIYRSDDEGLTWTQIGRPPSLTGITMWLPDGRMLATTRGGIQISTDKGGTWEDHSRMERIRSFALHPNGNLFGYRDARSKAGADSNGLYLSTDLGITWRRIFDGLVRSYRIMPDSSIWLNQGRDVFHSTDGGETWVLKNEGLMYAQIKQFQIDRAGRLYALLWGHGYSRDDPSPSQYYTLYQSDNYGGSWRKIKDSLAPEVLMIDSADNIYVAELRSTPPGSKQLYRSWFTRSTDLGTTWTPVNGDSSVVALAFNQKGVMIARSVENDALLRVIVSTDTGNTWRKTEFTAASSFSMGVYDFDYYQNVMVSSTKGIFITREINSSRSDQGLYRSSDLGVTWTRVDTTIVQRTRQFGIAPWGGLFASPATQYGNPNDPDRKVKRSLNDGISWHIISGFTSAQRFVFAPNGHVYAEGLGEYPTVRSTSSGSTWEKVVVAGLPENTPVQELSFTPKGDIGGIANGRPYLSTDGGISWRLADDGLPANTAKFMVAAPNGYLFTATDNAGVYISTKLQGVDHDPEYENSHASALHEPLPNPSNGEVTLSFTLKQPSVVTLHLHDLTGREVAGPFHLNGESGMNEFQMDISGLASGSYIVSLKTGTATHTRHLLRR